MVRSGPPARRAGHSLPELIVAVTFLATTVVAVGGTAVLGARWTTRAVAVQEAARLAAATLDSLAALPDPEAGTREAGHVRVAWRPIGEARVRVVVWRVSDGRRLLVLEGARTPAVPVLPDVGASWESMDTGPAAAVP